MPTSDSDPPADPQAPLSVLLVDDEEPLVRSCKQILAGEGYEVLTASRGAEAMEIVRRHRPPIVLSDLVLSDTGGIDLLRSIMQHAPDTLVVMIPDSATVDSSVEAIRAGAYDYIPKPFTATQLLILIGRAAEQVRLARDNAELRLQLRRQHGFDGIVGNSTAIRRVSDLVSRAASTDASVFLAGESGTGKELFAHALHQASPRAGGAFVAVNCAALPDQLLESELFGHERGAFTGAESGKRGLIESASGGTFFLDEISEMSRELQAKLLRVVQERRIRRVGGEVEIAVDVRWISATNRPLEEVVQGGWIRKDLYYRLNVVPVQLPPLRERREDVVPLVQHFIVRFAEAHGRAGVRVSPEALRMLEEYDWPGNVRELQNVVERIVTLATPGAEIGPSELPPELAGARSLSGGGSVFELPFHEAKDEVIGRFEQDYLKKLLQRYDGNVSRAALASGVDRKTIHRLLVKHGLNDRD